MTKLYIRPAASADIDEIIDYLAGENSSIAQGFIQDLQQSFDLLANNPKIGVKRQYHLELLSEMRMFPLKKFSSYLIFYQTDDGAIDVVRLLHGQRDIERLFQETEL